MITVLIIPVILINIASFILFAVDHFLYMKGYSGWRRLDDKAIIIAAFGAIGAYIATFVYGFENFSFDYHKVYRIVLPIAVVIQIAVVLYILLFDLGIVK